MNLFTSFSLYPSDSPVFLGQAAASAGRFGFSEYRVLGTFREPRVFNTSADALVTGTLEQQIRSSFNFARRGAGVQIARRLTRDVSATVAYQIQRTRVFDQNIDPADQLLIDRAFPQVRLSSFSGLAHRRHARRRGRPGAGALSQRQRPARGARASARKSAS